MGALMPSEEKHWWPNVSLGFLSNVSQSFLNNVTLSFLDKRKNKQVCRICRELDELKTEGLCAHCVWIKSQISVRFGEAVRGTIAIPGQQRCERYGCSCAACDGRTLAPHPLYLFDLARGDRREIHFHPRCHELWLEAVNGLTTNPEHISDIGTA